MPSFVFTARDSAGRPQSGVLASGSAGELVSQLRGRGWIVLDIQPQNQRGGSTFSLSALNPFSWLPATKLDVELGFQQIASMLRSGLTLLSAIKTAGEQSRRPAMAKIWQGIYESIEEGSSFATALSAHSIFPEFTIQLVRVGEQSGTLETVLTRAADQLERSRNLRMMLLNALMYPAIVLVMALGVTIFMLVSVIPKLQKFLSGRGRSLPAITQALIDVSHWVQVYGLTILIATVALIFAGFVIYKFQPARLVIDAFTLRVPVVGELLRVAATAMFARSLGLLLESGVTLLEALQTIERLLGNEALSQHIDLVRQTVMQGGTLAAPLSAKRLFMPMLSRTVAVGETTGTLDRVLSEVAEFHEKQLAAAVRRLSVIIEPVIILVVGGIVGFVYIAFFVALFSLAR